MAEGSGKGGAACREGLQRCRIWQPLPQAQAGHAGVTHIVKRKAGLLEVCMHRLL